MIASTLEIRDVLVRRSAGWVGHDVPPYAVTIEPWGPVFLARVVFETGPSVFVVKPMGEDCQPHDVVDLAGLHEAVRGRTSLLADRLVPIYAANRERRWLVMPLVPGESLETIMRRALHAGEDDARIAPALAAGVEALAAVHRLNADEMGLRHAGQANEVYLDSMRWAWSHPLMRLCVPGRARREALFASVCSDAFLARTGDRLLPVDVQPKNQIVGDDGRMTLIDPSYVAGHPGMTLAAYLVNLDRLALRFPSAGSWRLIEQWKRELVAACQRKAEPWVLADWPAFYPWYLMRVFASHVRHHRLAGPYLAGIYGRSLRSFVREIGTAPAAAA
ncbi:MAG: hypothetical protein ACOCTI_00470 [Phycisphaeraceae bacterium]